MIQFLSDKIAFKAEKAYKTAATFYNFTWGRSAEDPRVTDILKASLSHCKLAIALCSPAQIPNYLLSNHAHHIVRMRELEMNATLLAGIVILKTNVTSNHGYDLLFTAYCLGHPDACQHLGDLFFELEDTATALSWYYLDPFKTKFRGLLTDLMNELPAALSDLEAEFQGDQALEKFPHLTQSQVDEILSELAIARLSAPTPNSMSLEFDE